MNDRTLLLVTCAAVGMLAASSGQAMPLETPHAAAVPGAATPVDYCEHRDDDDNGDYHRNKHDRHGENREHDSYANHGDDDDDGREEGRSGTPPMQQNATPPVNSLFAPGVKPHVQMN